MFFQPRYKFGKITKHWGDANFKKEFDSKLDVWLKQFDKEEIPVLLELLKSFYYYTEKAIDKKVVELHNKFLELYGENLEGVVFAKTPKEFGVANSDLIFASYWLNNNIKGNCFNDVIRELLESDVIPKTLVVVDDYLGSGDTVVKALYRMLEIAPELHNSKLYFLTIHATIIGERAVAELKKRLGLDLTLIYLDNTDKAFKEDYIFSKIDVRLKQELYQSVCTRKSVNPYYILGYKDVESLVSFEKTTPNDTLGLFWHSAENFVSLFKKTYSKKDASINALKSVARKNSHRDIVLFDIQDNQYNRFIVYCILNGNAFSFERACADFGITTDILLKRLQYIEEKGYIKIEGGEIMPTNETESKLIRNKLKGWAAAEKSLKQEGKIPLKETLYVPRNFSSSFSGYKK